jgi:hypothetical protein
MIMILKKRKKIKKKSLKTSNQLMETQHNSV